MKAAKLFIVFGVILVLVCMLSGVPVSPTTQTLSFTALLLALFLPND